MDSCPTNSVALLETPLDSPEETLTPDDLEEADDGNGGKSDILHKQEKQNQDT
jgi:hypothetical protein